MSAVIKPKRCRVCRRHFEPRNSLQQTCSPNCAIAYARMTSPKKLEVDFKMARAAEKRETRERLKSRRDWIKDAQAAFNAWVRERDRFMPCVSCGEGEKAWTRGGAWDCGHYRSIGANPELRFEPLNCAKQCKKCNRDLSGNVVNFRNGLLTRIGSELLAWLEGPHEPRKYTVDELKAIAREYRAKLKLLRAARESAAMLA